MVAGVVARRPQIISLIVKACFLPPDAFTEDHDRQIASYYG